MNKLMKFARGFTLVELMVAVAIISLLSGIIVTNLTSSKSKARDGKRISDMGQIQLAVELFFDRCKTYPLSITGNPADQECLTNLSVNLGNYISKIPQPSGEKGQSEYGYYTNVGGSITEPTDYVLKAVLENYNVVLKDGLSTLPSWATSLTTCDNTDPANEYCLNPSL